MKPQKPSPKRGPDRIDPVREAEDKLAEAVTFPRKLNLWHDFNLKQKYLRI